MYIFTKKFVHPKTVHRLHLCDGYIVFVYTGKKGRGNKNDEHVLFMTKSKNKRDTTKQGIIYVYTFLFKFEITLRMIVGMKSIYWNTKTVTFSFCTK